MESHCNVAQLRQLDLRLASAMQICCAFEAQLPTSIRNTRSGEAISMKSSPISPRQTDGFASCRVGEAVSVLSLNLEVCAAFR